MKSDPKRPPHPADKDLAYLCPTRIPRIAQHDNFACSRIGQKDIAVRRHRQPAWDPEIRREDIHAKSFRYCGQKSRGWLLALRSITRRLGFKRRGQFRLLSVGYLRRQVSAQI